MIWNIGCRPSTGVEPEQEKNPSMPQLRRRHDEGGSLEELLETYKKVRL